MNKPVLGCIADDLTGATDLANNLARAGMRVVLTIDTPAHGEAIDADAIVVALKTRTIPAAEAVAQSLHSCRWLREPRSSPNLFQDLLYLRFDPSGQHWSGHRGTDGGVGLRL